ncbi:MAG: hypothetical protein HDR38_05785 [Treponema sp.]|nr:hypothetical protein [Treponema sp.]
MKKYIYLLLVAVLPQGIISCSNTGAKSYEVIQKYSVNCVEKALTKLTTNSAQEDIMSPQWLTLIGGLIEVESDIAKKINGLDYKGIVISQNIDTIMQGSKFCYSLVNATLPDSSSFQFLVKFDGDGTTGTEGKARWGIDSGILSTCN